MNKAFALVTFLGIAAEAFAAPPLTPTPAPNDPPTRTVRPGRPNPAERPPVSVPPARAVTLPALLTDYERSYVADPYTNCGTLEIGSPARAVDDCVISNWGKGLPFVGRFARQGIDSSVIDSLVSPGHGSLTSLVYDSNICGSGGWGPTCGERVFAYRCSSGVIAIRPAGERLTCEHPKRQP